MVFHARSRKQTSSDALEEMHGRDALAPGQKKARQTKSKFEALMILFLYIKTIVYADWVPQGQTKSTTRVFWKFLENELKERGLGCGETIHGSFIKTTRQHMASCKSSLTWLSTASPCWSIHFTLLIWLHMTSFCSPWLRLSLWMLWRRKRRSSWEAYHRIACSTATG